MRINELHLKAFGPFVDRRLDFSRGACGLHVIFGPNEAGKSSALRALKALLYGVDERTTDAFVCGNEQLRVGGRLTLADGREITFVRRKGRKNTVLSPADNRTLDEALLVPFLSGVSSSVFSSMFGIDHQTLVEGGAAILQQNGDVGSTLFAAALGNRRLQTTLAELEGEAGELYRPSGSKYVVNKAFAEFKDARGEMKNAALAVKDWDTHRQSLDDATRRLDEISGEMSALLREQHAVERLTRILPRVALRRTHLAAIASMGPVVELAADFAERRRALLSKKLGAEEALAAGRRKRELLHAEAETFVPPGRILDEERTVRLLYQRLGSYRKSLDDRPAIEGKRQQARNDARDILKRLRPDLTLDDVPPLRPAIVAAKRPIQELATRHQAVETAERKARKALADKDREIAGLQDALQVFSQAQDAGPLKRAVAEARRAGDLDSLLRDSVRAEAKLDRQCRDELTALGLWHGPLEAVHALPVPGHETVARHVEAFRLADEQQRSLADERRRTTRDMADVERGIEGMRLAGAVPTEVDLVQARTRREEGWTLVKRAWLEHVDVTDAARAYDEARGLPEAYETTTAAADDVVDRLRREADRVAAHAHALARRDQLERDLADLDRQEAEHVAARRALLIEWTGAWVPGGIAPQSPEEMRAWLTRLASLKEHVTVLSDKRDQTQAMQETLAGHQRTLAARLIEVAAQPPACGETLNPFLEQADAIVEGIEAIATKRKDLRRLIGDRAKIAGDLEHASTDLEAWKADWSAELRSFGQPADARPAHVQSLVDGYTELFTKLDEEDAQRRRVYGIDQDIKEFEEEVRAFVKDVAPESEDAEISRCVERLNDALKRATTDKTNRDALDKQMRDLVLHIEETDARLEMDKEGLAALCREARCDRAEELEDAEQRSDALRTLRETVMALDHEIVAAGDGASLEALMKQAEETLADDLPARMGRVTERIGERENERGRLRETKGAEENEMRRMTGISTSADAAAKAQEILASMRRHVETYLRTRVAALVLKKEVERYRDAHQDPLLVRGGALFASLSCGSFATISSEIADDEPRLVGVRPDGASVHVGGMSSGTRDQLYLALRCATLERYLTSSEPMPFVVDDILINFDDRRALATLEVLAEFSAKTQVLLFTHHTRIRDMAAELASPNGVFVQSLP